MPRKFVLGLLFAAESSSRVYTDISLTIYMLLNNKTSHSQVVLRS